MLAYLIAAISPNMDTANAALPAYVTVLLFFSGFLITWPKIPKYWIWMAYMDFMRYGWGALMINQFQGQNVRDAVPAILCVLCCAVLCCAIRLLIPIQLHARHGSTSALHVQTLTIWMVEFFVSPEDAGLLNARESDSPTAF